MWKKLPFLILILGISPLIYAQDYLQKAQNLQQKHKDFEAYTDYAKEKYTFKVNSGEKKVEVKELGCSGLL